jgi:hypothetical protein
MQGLTALITFHFWWNNLYFRFMSIIFVLLFCSLGILSIGAFDWGARIKNTVKEINMNEKMKTASEPCIFVSFSFSIWIVITQQSYIAAYAIDKWQQKIRNNTYINSADERCTMRKCEFWIAGFFHTIYREVRFDSSTWTNKPPDYIVLLNLFTKKKNNRIKMFFWMATPPRVFVDQPSRTDADAGQSIIHHCSLYVCCEQSQLTIWCEPFFCWNLLRCFANAFLFI